VDVSFSDNVPGSGGGFDGPCCRWRSPTGWCEGERDEGRVELKERRKKGVWGGHHRELGERRCPPLILVSFEARASGGVTNSMGRSGGCTRALWRRTTACGGENLGSVAIDAFYTAWQPKNGGGVRPWRRRMEEGRGAW
jgi:hypothetical protein